jgi:WD40 repeat protein
VEKDGKRLLDWKFDGEVRSWDLSTGELKKIYKHVPARSIIWTHLSPDGSKLVTYDELPGIQESQPKRAVSVWDVRTGQYLQLPDGLESNGRFSPNGRILATTTIDEDGCSHALKLFETSTGKENLSIPVKEKTWVWIRAFSPDSRLLVTDWEVFEDAKKRDRYESWLKWWDTATGKEVASFGGKADRGFGWASFSQDGQTLAVTQNHSEGVEMLFFDVRNKQLKNSVLLAKKSKGERVIVRRPPISPDGKWLAVITQEFPENQSGQEPDVQDVPQARIHLIDVAAGEIRETMVSPPGFPIGSAFSPDGRTLATGGHGRVLLWDLADLAEQKVGVRK